MNTKTYTENLYNITFNSEYDETAIDITEVTDKLVPIKLC